MREAFRLETSVPPDASPPASEESHPQKLSYGSLAMVVTELVVGRTLKWRLLSRDNVFDG